LSATRWRRLQLDGLGAEYRKLYKSLLPKKSRGGGNRVSSPLFFHLTS
jgi:hypothetical protein